MAAMKHAAKALLFAIRAANLEDLSGIKLSHLTDSAMSSFPKEMSWVSAVDLKV